MSFQVQFFTSLASKISIEKALSNVAQRGGSRGR